MLHRRFGRTELQMPLFSCGSMRFHHQWTDCPLDQIPPQNQANLLATLQRALQLGINHFETARAYGSSERQLGAVLPAFPRDQIIVQTKIAPTPDPALFTRHVHESLDRLQLAHLDLLALHGVNTYQSLHHAIRPNGCLAAARRLQAQGLVRHVGFSTHAPLPLILDAMHHDRDGGFDFVNLHYYFINQDNLPALQLAQRLDMGLFIISPSDKGGMLYNPPPKLIDLCHPLHPLVFNALFCLAHPEIHTLSLGPARPSDFDLQLSTLPLLDQADSLLQPITARLTHALHHAVGPDVAQHFTQGLPDWHDAPGYINIKTILFLRNLALAYDMLDYARMRYNLLGNGGHWFPGLNAAHLDEHDLTKSLQNSPFAHQIPTWLRETHALLAAAPTSRLTQS